MRSCDATSAAASDLAGPTRFREELAAPAMTVERRSRQTTAKHCSSGRSSFPFRGPCPTATRPAFVSGLSTFTSGSGNCGMDLADHSSRSQRPPRFSSQCFRRQRRTSLASQTGVALSRATGRGKSERLIQRPAWLREVSRISATSASPASSSFCGGRGMCKVYTPMNAPAARERSGAGAEGVSFDAIGRLSASHAASGPPSRRGAI